MIGRAEGQGGEKTGDEEKRRKKMMMMIMMMMKMTKGIFLK